MLALKPEIVDVDGGRWIPVQADVLRELCDLATSHWISVKEQLPEPPALDE